MYIFLIKGIFIYIASVSYYPAIIPFIHHLYVWASSFSFQFLDIYLPNQSLPYLDSDSALIVFCHVLYPCLLLYQLIICVQIFLEDLDIINIYSTYIVDGTYNIYIFIIFLGLVLRLRGWYECLVYIHEEYGN